MAEFVIGCSDDQPGMCHLQITVHCTLIPIHRNPPYLYIYCKRRQWKSFCKCISYISLAMENTVTMETVWKMLLLFMAVSMHLILQPKIIKIATDSVYIIYIQYQIVWVQEFLLHSSKKMVIHVEWQRHWIKCHDSEVNCGSALHSILSCCITYLALASATEVAIEKAHWCNFHIQPQQRTAECGNWIGDIYINFKFIPGSQTSLWRGFRIPF